MYLSQKVGQYLHPMFPCVCFLQLSFKENTREMNWRISSNDKTLGLCLSFYLCALHVCTRA